MADAQLSPADAKRLEALEALVGRSLQDRAAALCALTHSSYVNEHPDEGRDDNERLEFLGDAVADLAVSERLMRRFPDASEGELTRLRASLVDEEGLASVARRVGLGELLILGRGEEQSGGRDKSSVLANALEAVIAVVFKDAGLEAALTFVDRIFGEALANPRPGGSRDYKSQLQELVQSRLKVAPRYRLVGESGPDHAKTFCVEIEADGAALGRGEGRSKKEAEQAAAREALLRLQTPAGG